MLVSSLTKDSLVTLVAYSLSNGCTKALDVPAPFGFSNPHMSADPPLQV